METEERLTSTAEEPAAKGPAALIVPAQEIDRAVDPGILLVIGRAVALERTVLEEEQAIDLVAAPEPIDPAAEPVLTGPAAAERARDLPAGLEAAEAIELVTAPYLHHQEAAVTAPSAVVVAAATADAPPAPAAAEVDAAWEAEA